MLLPAVANAIYDAVKVRVDELPITPDKILRALDEKKTGGVARVGPRSFPKISWPEPLLVPPPWEGGTGHATNEEQTKKPKKSGDAGRSPAMKRQPS